MLRQEFIFKLRIGTHIGGHAPKPTMKHWKRGFMLRQDVGGTPSFSFSSCGLFIFKLRIGTHIGGHAPKPTMKHWKRGFMLRQDVGGTPSFSVQDDNQVHDRTWNLPAGKPYRAMSAKILSNRASSKKYYEKYPFPILRCA
ncbi:hypothetical protein M413DRAFT_9436 [Hebeloma cylindrosporum]|uniref:Uncharacterized protein n=1 Tax=Hebeloma cylindrosporum TaxID=76867 RepID=A0A0C2YTG2_HEBCY|nr:hypothetical protein M413DRAFT_9436 [Hebeloma cylindrosporum h7]